MGSQRHGYCNKNWKFIHVWLNDWESWQGSSSHEALFLCISRTYGIGFNALNTIFSVYI